MAKVLVIQGAGMNMRGKSQVETFWPYSNSWDSDLINFQPGAVLHPSVALRPSEDFHSAARGPAAFSASVGVSITYPASRMSSCTIRSLLQATDA